MVSIKIADETDNMTEVKPVASEQKPADNPPPHASLEKKPSRFSVTKTPENALNPVPPTVNGKNIPTISITLADSATPEEQVNCVYTLYLSFENSFILKFIYSHRRRLQCLKSRF